MYCLFQEAKKFINMTESRGILARNKAYGIVDFESIDTSTVKYKLPDYSYIRFEPVPNGMVEQSFKFGTVARPIGYDIHSLIKPFDISTLVLLFTSAISLFIYFQVSLRLLGKRSIVGTHILSVLLEQSQDIVTNCKKLNKDASFLIISWLLLTFLVANAYKGVLFTILTTPFFQGVPQTTQEVLQSNYSVWTTDRRLYYCITCETELIITTGFYETYTKYQKLNHKTAL